MRINKKRLCQAPCRRSARTPLPRTATDRVCPSTGAPLSDENGDRTACRGPRTEDADFRRSAAKQRSGRVAVRAPLSNESKGRGERGGLQKEDPGFRRVAAGRSSREDPKECSQDAAGRFAWHQRGGIGVRSQGEGARRWDATAESCVCADPPTKIPRWTLFFQSRDTPDGCSESSPKGERQNRSFSHHFRALLNCYESFTF
jgi:hypothetical protein